MYQLFTLPGTCSTGIHILLNALGADFTVAIRDQVTDYQKMVPTNQVPALIDGDQVITEGAAIVLHLIDKHQVDLNKYGNPSDFYRWLMFNYATLHPAYSKLFSAKFKLAEGEDKQVYMQTLADETKKLWQIIDHKLQHQPFIMGESVTVIDYLLAIYVSWGRIFDGLALPVGENVLKMVDKVRELPQFKAAFEREDAEFAVPDNAK